MLIGATITIPGGEWRYHHQQLWILLPDPRGEVNEQFVATWDTGKED